ncbi:MAG: NapC/NirT family cytochrome c [Mariniphaga sp.]|nr:NapC/NirT family cytochrome c [Mariniphaga sp.]
MRYVSFLKLICFGVLCAFLATSCVKEGPMGPQGADGSDGSDGMDGVDGNVSCLACHNSDNIESIQGQFAMSVHSAGAIAVDYAGSRASCSPCHSHEQFVQYAELGQVAGDITNPTAWKCNTCHGLHETFETTDYALRLDEPVIGLFDKVTVLDMKGNSNLCANCHQSRAGDPLASNPSATTFNVTARTGPHHGPQANLVAGVGFAEIEGSVSYPEPNSSYHLNETASCTGCHMGEFGNRSGGHSWIPSLNNCNTCHETENYNYGGRQTDVALKLDQIRDKLVELGVMTGDAEAGFSVVPGSYPIVLARAYFNWIGIEEDRSLGVHNPRYISALLINTLEALNAYQPEA